MASGPITSWQIDGETGTDFIFSGSKITANGDCIHEIKGRLLLGRKVTTNLDNILKSWDITLPTKVHLLKAMVFSIVMYGCESWTIKKAEWQRNDAFELWFWRRLLRVPWTPRSSNQSILKEISPEYSLQGVMLKQKLPIPWPPDVKNWLIGKDSDAGKDWRQEKGTMEDEMVGCITDSMDVSMSELWEMVMDREAWRTAPHGVAKGQTWLSGWATARMVMLFTEPGPAVTGIPSTYTTVILNIAKTMCV